MLSPLAQSWLKYQFTLDPDDRAKLEDALYKGKTPQRMIEIALRTWTSELNSAEMRQIDQNLRENMDEAVRYLGGIMGLV